MVVVDAPDETTLIPSDAVPHMTSATCAENAMHESQMLPRTVLWILTAMNFLLYFDRGATVGAIFSIRSDRTLTEHGSPLSDAQSGFLASGFVIGYLVASPILTSCGSAWGSRTVILFGLALWAAACLACAVSCSYAALLTCRTLVGVAEAAFVGFVVTIIDNIAPPVSRTSWIGFFYSMIPIGTAVGMGCGGVLTSYPTLWGITPWRVIFVAQVGVVLPLAALLCHIPARYHLPPAVLSVSRTSFLTATTDVLGNTNYMLLVLGFSTHCFVTGALSIWSIPFLHEGPLQLGKKAAAAFMGAATASSGVVGSLLGGLAVDHWGGSAGPAGATQCQKFNILMILIALPSGEVALFSTNAFVFALSFIVGVVALFAITAPMNASILTIVPADIRPYAVSYSVFIIHFLGDFLSPTLTGLLSDYLGRHCRDRSIDACYGSEEPFQCAWIAEADGQGRCLSRVQLRDAISFVFMYLLVALPCWAAVWWRIQRKVKLADVSVGSTGELPPSCMPTAPAFLVSAPNGAPNDPHCASACDKQPRHP
ncbi:hypothetical protein LSCM1_06648 [Leishmania martiniquensis]|uniref:Major facilitator superfamily (MFS) profile domain-containing protein n=1 Tax=Leishmania martiniquensis TaxID=1580590 RepID=A0A836GVN0_9TRYP|nr:hypothetical protein LSCM1_06648 [Leishmania martiniquensis]